jgi:hypothetical protein
MVVVRPAAGSKITEIAWSPKGALLAAGTHNGAVSLVELLGHEQW